MPSASNKNTTIAFRIGTYLNVYAMAHDLGVVVGADSGFQLNETTFRQTDTAFVRKERADMAGKFFSAPPDLAVEVIPESETARKVTQKIRLYLEAGTTLVWSVYPEAQIVEVHRLNADGSITTKSLTVDQSLEGEAVLPGFSLPVKSMFLQ